MKDYWELNAEFGLTRSPSCPRARFWDWGA